MAGIYIHIPFCRSRCIYCGFYSTTSLELRQRYVEAVCREMEIRSLSKGSGSISTIYFGGGTPSQLTIPQLRQFLLYINKVYQLPQGAGGRLEITIEVNPDDVTEAFAEGLRSLTVNRVSMGAQTFNDERLRFLHRRHTSQQVIEAVSRLRAVGINNISVDLMYGFPGETLSEWQKDIEAALALNVEHLSAYCLTVEEGTILHKLISGEWRVDSYDYSQGVQGNHNCPLSTIHYPLPDEELERQMYELLIDRLEAAGYEHYEISNFAKPGYRSRHNSSYWNDTPYIGLGAAAHSYDGHTRSWNVSDLQQYIEGIEHGERRFEEEIIDADTHYNDMVTVALRTREGLDLSSFPEQHRAYAISSARPFIDDGLLALNGSRLSLTRRGLFVSDMIMSALIYLHNSQKDN